MASVDQGIAEAPGARWMAPSATLFVVVIAVLTLARLIGQHFSVVDINTDEAQYWEWGQTLAFGYFSKPPLIAWVNWLSDAACGDTIQCIRAPSPLFYAGTSLAIYGATRVLYGATTAFWAGLLLATAPGVTFSTRIMSTDVPLLFFWALALLAYARLLRGGGWGWAVLLAVGIGFGLLAKYAMAYFAIGIFAGALVDRDARALLGNPRLWAGLAGGIVLFLPNVVWNLSNGLVTASATADYVTPHGPGIHFAETLTFLVAQFAVFGPVTFGTLLSVSARFGSRALTPTDRLLVLFALPPVIVVTLSGLYSGNAYANWAATGAVAAAVVTAAVLVREGWWRTLITGITVALIVQATMLLADPFAARLSFPVLGKSADIYRSTMGWRSLDQGVDALIAKTGAATVATEGRDEVSVLSYYRRSDPQPVVIWPRDAAPSNQFELTQALRAGAAEPILFLSDCASGDRLTQDFASVSDLGPVSAATGPRSARTYRAFLLSGMHGPLPPLGACS